ncbi:MAG: DUF493 domain-containing protein [Gemmatimonadota bacterium]|nr:DUF493 domain-containing protein [Gemmatimonadota bacterium]MDE2954871.1 DUF493 domain-containing protein [Gemmatimonadota bacterium]
MLERQPEIEYPCLWNFKIIGREEKHMRRAIAKIVGDSDYTLTFSNQSRYGKYRSLNLDMVVLDESHRLNIYEALRHHRSIQIVL